LRGCANPVASPLSPLGTKFTSTAKNASKLGEFKFSQLFCAEEGNEGYAARLEELHIATMAWLAKHVANRNIWKGYPAHLLAKHRDKDGKLRTRATAE
jgi:hypothetical protein